MSESIHESVSVEYEKGLIPEFLMKYLPKQSQDERIIEYRKARKKLPKTASKAEKSHIASMCIRAHSNDPKDHYLFADDMNQLSGDKWIDEYTDRLIKVADWQFKSDSPMIYDLDKLKNKITSV